MNKKNLFFDQKKKQKKIILISEEYGNGKLKNDSEFAVYEVKNEIPKIEYNEDTIEKFHKKIKKDIPFKNCISDEQILNNKDVHQFLLTNPVFNLINIDFFNNHSKKYLTYLLNNDFFNKYAKDLVEKNEKDKKKIKLSTLTKKEKQKIKENTFNKEFNLSGFFEKTLTTTI